MKFLINCAIFIINVVAFFTVMPWIFFDKLRGGEISLAGSPEHRVVFLWAIIVAVMQWVTLVVLTMWLIHPELFYQ
jgi:hypothetical protein